ncbi:hypothetical protein V7024_14290 [Bacillus sp. JJ864]|uniref:hypothetical protein n=1 Tax=Bacillus TaxID=1386 RepID=UPI000BF46BEC|nr:hypothetical protein [Bacillus wiedmannii]
MNFFSEIFSVSNIFLVLGFLLAMGGYLLFSFYKKVKRFPEKVTLNIAILLCVVGVVLLFFGYVM